MGQGDQATQDNGNGGGDPLIRLVGVSKRFASNIVLDELNLAIERGKTTVIVGPSGTGKSVLLKHIVGLLNPDQGEVWYEDQRVDRLSAQQLVELRKKIGFLFQMGALFDSMSVRANIAFPLQQHLALEEDEERERCEQVLRLVGLADFGDRMPAQLSGGQKKRVALARAIVLEPQVVLYDEPTTGLDPIRADVINELILQLTRKLGITSIAVTHDMASANKIGDRMVMLYDGKIVADGDPNAFQSTESELVQRFIHGQADTEDLERIRNGFEDNGKAARIHAIKGDGI